ncbi:MAG: type IV pilus twitching motility protein PilT [Candidatus Omnitrophota bacterium]
MDDLFRLQVERRASDLHLTVGVPPQLRIDGRLTLMEGDALVSDDTKVLVYSILTKEQKDFFESQKELDFSYSLKGVSRFRINVYMQRGAISMSARAIPFEIPAMEDLCIPWVSKEFAERPHGLFLVTGPVGAGKSTTLATMVDYINTSREARIVTIEDPIEYLHKHKRSVIDQREVGSDTLSFGNALRHVFREDPNIVLIGEMRDLVSMQMALTLAETGHLILTTLHTTDAVHSVSRIIDAFPPHQQSQIRVQLSMNLLGVISQQLIPRAQDRPGRVLATEVMNVTPSIRNLIRENDLPQIYSCIQTGKKYAMHTMNQSLVDWYKKGDISFENALQRSGNPDELTALASGI